MSGRQISSRSYGGFGGSGRHGNSSYVSSYSAKFSSGNRLNSCVVCCHAIPGEHRRAIFAIGPCDHPICYHCAAKMRVLCEQNECPICRQAVSEVVFSEDSQKKFASFNLLLFDCNSEYNIYFESKSCLDTFNSLLEERCKKCKAPAASIADLQEHLWEKHRLFTCGVCVQNLKIFSEERKYYNSSQLEHHMKSGDPDDRSYQGHPACQLCDQCYLDADELNRHLKREHYHCHLCDFDKTIYYNKYEVLNQHFRDKHFLCEEGNCKNEQFTSVFRTLIDLQAHKAEVHCLTKSEAKSARTLSLDFTFNPSSRGPRNGSYNPTVSASLNEGLNSRGMGRRGRGDRGERGGGSRGGPPTISEDDWMSEDLSSLGAAGPAQLRPEDFPSLDDTGRNNPPIGQENPLSVSFKPPTKANTNQDLTSNDNQNSKAPKKPKHKFSTKVKESASFGQKDDEEFPALCLSDSTGGRRTGFNRHVPQSNASSAKSISLADAVKLNSNPSEKTTSQPSDNITKTSKSTKTSNNSNNNRIFNDLTDPNDPTSSQDFSLLQNDFPSLPFKVNGNRKKKKSLNILLASLSNPQPDPPSKYTSVRLVDSFSIPKENNGSTSNKNDSDNRPSLEEDMESLLLKEDNFPPLSGESKKKDTKIKSSGPAKSFKALSKTLKQATSSSSSSSAATTTATSVVRPPPGYEKRNLNKTKNTSSELTLEAVAQQVIKPIITAPSNSTIKNHVDGKKSELSKKTDSINNVDQNELNNSNVSNNSKSNDKASKKPTLSPSNQRKVKRENFEPSSIDPTNSKAAKQSSTNKSTINSRISPSSPTSFSQHPPTSTQSERPASSSNSRHHQNGTTNSSGNRPTSNYGESSEYTYIYPDDFDDRNHKLFEKIQSILKDRFSDFDKISRAFFNDDIPSHHYYNKCVDMFRNKLSSVLLELIVLLPDIRKQKHLMAAHDSAVKQRDGAAPIKTGVWEIKTDSELDIVVCPMCGQVLSKKDGAHHIIKHQQIKS